MMHYWNYNPGYYSYNSGFSVFSLILNVLFWGLVVMLIVKLFRHKSHHCCEHEMIEDETVGDKSLGIVKERYAKGEIDKKEFEQLKKDLS